MAVTNTYTLNGDLGAHEGKLRAVLGSPGGPTIVTTVTQIVMQHIDAWRGLEQAVGAVRSHHR